MRFVFFFFPPHTDKLPTLLNKSEFHEHSEGFVCVCAHVSQCHFWTDLNYFGNSLFGSLNTPFLMCGERVFPTTKKFSGRQLGVLQFNSILTLYTWKQHQIPQVMGSVLPDHTALHCHPPPYKHTHTHTHTSDVNRKSRLSPVLLTDWL